MLNTALLLLADDRNQGWFGALAGTFVVVWFIIAIAITIFSIYCCWRVAQKSGYNGAWSLLLLIPVVNIIIELIWVFSEWPIEAELKRLRAQAQRTP